MALLCGVAVVSGAAVFGVAMAGRTWAATRAVRQMPPERFRQAVAVLRIALEVQMIVAG